MRVEPDLRAKRFNTSSSRRLLLVTELSPFERWKNEKEKKIRKKVSHFTLTFFTLLMY